MTKRPDPSRVAFDGNPPHTAGPVLDPRLLDYPVLAMFRWGIREVSTGVTLLVRDFTWYEAYMRPVSSSRQRRRWHRRIDRLASSPLLETEKVPAQPRCNRHTPRHARTTAAGRDALRAFLAEDLRLTCLPAVCLQLQCATDPRSLLEALAAPGPATAVPELDSVSKDPVSILPIEPHCRLWATRRKLAVSLHRALLTAKCDWADDALRRWPPVDGDRQRIDAK